MNLDIGLPVEQLQQPIKSCLSGESEQSETILEATNRREKTMRCRVACAPLRDASATLRGAIVLMSEVDA